MHATTEISFQLCRDTFVVLLWMFNIITSATKGEGGYVFTPFLSVCLYAGYLKKLFTDLDEILRTGWVCDKEEMFQFW